MLADAYAEALSRRTLPDNEFYVRSDLHEIAAKSIVDSWVRRCKGSVSLSDNSYSLLVAYFAIVVQQIYDPSHSLGPKTVSLSAPPKNFVSASVLVDSDCAQDALKKLQLEAKSDDSHILN